MLSVIDKLSKDPAELALDAQRLYAGHDRNVVWLDVLCHFPLLHDHLHSHHSPQAAIIAVAQMTPLVIQKQECLEKTRGTNHVNI